MYHLPRQQTPKPEAQVPAAVPPYNKYANRIAAPFIHDIIDRNTSSIFKILFMEYIFSTN